MERTVMDCFGFEILHHLVGLTKTVFQKCIKTDVSYKTTNKINAVILQIACKNCSLCNWHLIYKVLAGVFIL